MRKHAADPDQIQLKERKGTWLRFVKLFPKCRLPWVFLLLYLVLEIGIVNVGISETDYTAQLFAGDTSARVVATLVGVMILNLLFSNFSIFMGGVTSARINRNMRTALFNKIMRLPLTFFQGENPKEAIYRVAHNAIVLDSTLMLVIIPLITAGYTAVATLFNVFSYDWRLSIILLAFVPIQILLGFLFGRINFSLSERDSGLYARLTERLSEIINNIPLAKAFAKEDKESAAGEEYTMRLYRISIKSSWFDQLKDLSDSVLSLIQAGVITVVGVFLLRDSSIALRAWIAFYLFSSVFNSAVTQFLMYWNNLKIIQGGADRVCEIMDAKEENFSGEPCPALTDSIHLEHVRFEYVEGKPVLEDVCCTFPANGVTALLGISGCGKTTLINLLTRLYEPKGGAITIGGESIDKFALDSYRDRFCMVPQNAMLFSGTIRENICYGNHDVTDEKLESALKTARAYDFVVRLRGGLDARVEESGGNLSGGQRQRLALARALLSDAHYLILDEPTASLDTIATAELFDALREVSGEKCVIIIAHTAAVLPVCDRAVVLEDGVVSVQDEPEGAIASNSFLQALTGRGAGA